MPSVQAVLTVLGDEEIEPGLSLKKYLLNLSREAIEGAFLPWQDAVEVVIEWAHRRRIASIGGHLSQGADVAVSLATWWRKPRACSTTPRSLCARASG